MPTQVRLARKWEWEAGWRRAALAAAWSGFRRLGHTVLSSTSPCFPRGHVWTMAWDAGDLHHLPRRAQGDKAAFSSAPELWGLGDEIGMLGSAWAQGCWLLIAIYCPARLLCQLRISAARLGIYFQRADEKVAQAGAALLLGSTSTIQEHSGVGSGVQGTCQEQPGPCGVSRLPVGLEMPPGTGGAPRAVCPARPARQHGRRVGQGAGTGTCPE